MTQETQNSSKEILEKVKQIASQYKIHGIVAGIILCVLCIVIVKCSSSSSEGEESGVIEEEVAGNLVRYPGRTFSYKVKFNDLQTKQHAVASRIGLSRPPKDRDDASSMRKQLVEVKTGKNYIVDDLSHSVPYLIPSAKRELDSIGAEWADILHRNGLPHYRFYVTSILRTQADVKALQRSGNVNSTTQSCHCYGTTFDLAYMRYDKVSRTPDYMTEDNLKLVLGQVLLNEQRKGHIYVKYEWRQSCFHITVRR